MADSADVGDVDGVDALPDGEFEDWFAGRMAELPGVTAVALGGSRARGRQRPESDWDFALYYRGRFDADDLRAQGWRGEIVDVGGWPGVMNGGGWLRVGRRPVDIHYRDLDEIDHHRREAEHGRFDKQHIRYYLAGMPTYLPLGELAYNVVLRGELPRPEFPQQLRDEARRRWHDDAVASAQYAHRALHRHRDVALCAGNLSRALIEESHSLLAARGEWALNEKGLVRRAGLDHTVDGLPVEDALAAVTDLLGR